MIFFMQLGASCAARAEQHGSSLGALGLRHLAQRYLNIAATFASDATGPTMPRDVVQPDYPALRDRIARSAA
jgi:hypothetical protein